jgi:hypothetical protein
VPGRNLSTVCKVVLALSVLLLGADRVSAYVGPGAGVTFTSYAKTLLVLVLVAFSVVLLWPVYTLLHWIRGRKNPSATTSSLEATPEEARSVNPTDS